MSGRKIIFSIYLVVATIGCLSGWLCYTFERFHNSEYTVTLEQAKSLAAEFEEDVIKVIENRAYYNRTIFKNDEIQNEKAGFEKCFIPSFRGLAHLIPVSDFSFQDKDIATEILYPDGEFVRVSPAIKVTVENFEDCTSCHRHQGLHVGDVLGAIGIKINNVRG